ncbi:MAG: lytic murein transglycosylase B [Gammaproteobacteria bacterium]|nr:MAG: lytic murein transglycosylase B [Gammaproteobacteria bacterium]
MKRTLLGIFLTLFATLTNANAEQEATEPMAAFIAKAAEQTPFSAEEVRSLLQKAQKRQSILDAIARPAEGKPWYQYRKIFLTPQRINAGLDFWRKHDATLRRAEQTFKVPAEIIVAIIGVETFYGRHKGSYPVLDALYTLGFHYPPRAAFFRKELIEFLRLTHEEGWPAKSPLGSYAGAMGYGQFIPSSYRHYAIDFDGDGHRDLINNEIDAIGSVANYFHQHGWRWQAPVVAPVRMRTWQAAQLASRRITLSTKVGELARLGVELKNAQHYDPETLVMLLALREQGRKRYYAGFHNFWVITRYNRSPLYAMAVYQLAQAIREKRQP